VYAALAYYVDHREAIDARMTEDRAFAEALRSRTPSLGDQKLRSLRGEAWFSHRRTQTERGRARLACAWDRYLNC
jgi:hypothetical protein